MIKIHVVKLMKNLRFFLERELRENESKVARFHALIDYKARLDRRESILEKMISAKRRTNSEYDLLRNQMPQIESRIVELTDELHSDWCNVL